jgi:hypothetical protein
LGTGAERKVDVEEQIRALWEQRRLDKMSAKEDAEGRHGEVMLGIADLKSQVRRINGSVSNNDRRLTAMEAVERERIRTAAGSKVGPGALPAVTQVAASAGGASGAFLLLAGAGKLFGWW